MGIEAGRAVWKTLFLLQGTAWPLCAAQELAEPTLCEMTLPGMCEALETSHKAFRENTEATIFSVISQVLEFYSDSYYKTETAKRVPIQKPTDASAPPVRSLCKCGQVKCPLDRKESWRTWETFNSKTWRNISKRQWCQNEQNQTNKKQKTKSKWTNQELKGSTSHTETQPSLIRPGASGQSDTSRAGLGGGLGEESFLALTFHSPA